MTTRLFSLLSIPCILLVPSAPGQSKYPVLVDTNAQLVLPTNFWRANSNALNAAVADPRGQATLQAAPRLWAYERDGWIWLRWRFDPTNDALLALQRTNVNGLMSFVGYFLTPTNVAIGVHQWAGYHDVSDDLCPMDLYNAGYVGANHGWYLPQLTAAGHGLTTADLGKTWTSGTNSFALYKVVDGNTLLLVPQPGPFSSWTTNSIHPGTYLLAASGSLTKGTAAADLSYSAKSLVSEVPAGRVLGNGFALDGQPYGGQLAQGSEFTVRCAMEFPDATAAYRYATNHVGQSFSIAAHLPTWFTRSQVFRFHPWGQIELEEHLLLMTNSLSFADGNGPVQAARISPNPAYAATNLWLWMPGLTNAWSSPALNHSNTDTSFPAAQRHVPARPARVWVQWTGETNFLTPTNYLWGLAAGFEPVWDTSDAVRAAQSSDGWIAGSTRKIYPSAIVGRTVAAPASLHFRAWRSFFGKENQTLLCRLLLKADHGWACWLGWNTPGTNWISLPGWLEGRYCGLSDASGAALWSERVQGGVLVARTNAVGWMEIWIK